MKEFTLVSFIVYLIFKWSYFASTSLFYMYGWEGGVYLIIITAYVCLTAEPRPLRIKKNYQGEDKLGNDRCAKYDDMT